MVTFFPHWSQWDCLTNRCHLLNAATRFKSKASCIQACQAVMLESGWVGGSKPWPPMKNSLNSKKQQRLALNICWHNLIFFVCHSSPSTCWKALVNINKNILSVHLFRYKRNVYQLSQRSTKGGCGRNPKLLIGYFWKHTFIVAEIKLSGNLAASILDSYTIYTLKN